MGEPSKPIFNPGGGEGERARGRGGGGEAPSPPATANRLANEKSPYLLQHARNPVDWFPWGPEAFEKARKEDKPVFLSIGYSTCHWCHVMERESFEDPEVARQMNEAFVNVKVDREERPDVDALYMSVCQMVTGSGGWPLTILMTPDGKPFFAATYIPREARFGRMGMMELIPRVQEMWKNQRTQLLNSAAQVASALQEASPPPAGGDLGPGTLDTAFEHLARRFDEVNAGFGTAPKFPTPHNLLFLLRYWRRRGNPKALEMVERTLRAMRLGGVFDHVGFGFHRYSTDPEWLVPHFEKMLYDQALLAMACTEAFQATGKEEFARVAREILEYVLRDMTSPEGGFFSAEDADSEGEEGRFYLWREEELRRVLGQDEADLAARVWNVEKGGNFVEEATGRRTGSSILFLAKPLADVARDLRVEEADLRERLEAVRRRLFAARAKRVHPHKDDKILCDWNGLMVAALAKAARALDEPAYAESAARAADFVLSKMRDSRGRLLHRYREGEAAVAGTLDDHAFMAWGLIELYEATFDARHLRAALDLTRDMLAHFWDEKEGGLFLTADDAERLLVRPREVYDGAVPSGNSAAMLNLLRLGRMSGDAQLEERAARIGRALSGAVDRAPAAFTMLLCGLDFALGPTREIVLVGDPGAEDTAEMARALRRRFLPDAVVLFRPAGEAEPEIARIAPYVRDLKAVGGRATAYVCRNFACEMPVTDVRKMVESI